MRAEGARLRPSHVHSRVPLAQIQARFDSQLSAEFAVPVQTLFAAGHAKMHQFRHISWPQGQRTVGNTGLSASTTRWCAKGSGKRGAPTRPSQSPGGPVGYCVNRTPRDVWRYAWSSTASSCSPRNSARPDERNPSGFCGRRNGAGQFTNPQGSETRTKARRDQCYGWQTCYRRGDAVADRAFRGALLGSERGR